MNKFIRVKHAALLLALCGTLQAAPAFAQDQVVQDGIAVKPIERDGLRGRWRDFTAPEKAINEQSAQQYTALVSQAREKGVLVPESDPQVQRLRAIARRIIPNTARWNDSAQAWKWQVNLLKSDQVNAFCMPGGRIAFYTGIIDKLKLTDDEIAAVMGHEIAHALREHGRDRQSKSTTTGLVTGIGGALASAWLGYDVRGLANTAGQLVVLKFSRDEEREADLVGLDIAARSGYDPRAGIALWNKMAQLDKSGAPIALLSTHPGGSERIEQIQDHMDVLLPLYARSKGTSVERLPAYRSNVASR
ncbi:M48 family metallopeptidase [Massilia sp. YIM B02763]|uniref:M48 family metallopeptidase n=1 Tax=Massilia sp. YIM B02763 TaxID=3050130 RepID=UPI0025B6A347|nr:M48 family metallopeptidase [Massilia sp. YIM B02763]MDN4056037.1 M48 family metallopeptidase [Massilia sp. YIM B02763]